MYQNKHSRTTALGLPQDEVRDRQSFIAKINTIILWRAVPEGTSVRTRRAPDRAFGKPQSVESFLESVHPDDRKQLRESWRMSLERKTHFEASYRLHHSSGSFRWSVGRGIPIVARDGAVREWVGTIADVHAQVEAETAAAESEERLNAVLETTRIGIWDQDLSSGRIWLSQVAADLLGCSADQSVTESAAWALVHPDDRGELEVSTRLSSSAEERRFRAEVRLQQAAGNFISAEISQKVVSDAAGTPVRVVGTIRDTTEERSQRKALLRLAHCDDLTGLANRKSLANHASSVLKVSPALFLLLDLDGFKEVNDLFGHPVGDALLRLVAERLRTALPGDAFIARIGGDEFVVMVEGNLSDAEVNRMLEKIQRAFDAPFISEDRLLSVGVTIGVTLAPRDGATVEELMLHADLALYEAKGLGRGRSHFYTPQLAIRVQTRHLLSRELQQAVTKGEFELYYQPQFRLTDGVFMGAEALLRWRHPQLGIVPPAYFLSELKKSRWASTVGDWVVKTACSDAAAAKARGRSFRVAVNLFSAQFRTSEIDRTIAFYLDETGLPPELFEVEITENVLLTNEESTLRPLKSLRDLGCGIAFDDYGTGYASLSMLKRFPVTRLKVDRSFVSDIGLSGKDLAIVEAIVSLGRTFQLSVLAEGIETSEQAALLTQLGCDEGQGYLFGAPVPINEMLEIRSEPAT